MVQLNLNVINLVQVVKKSKLTLIDYVD